MLGSILLLYNTCEEELDDQEDQEYYSNYNTLSSKTNINYSPYYGDSSSSRVTSGVTSFSGISNYNKSSSKNIHNWSSRITSFTPNVPAGNKMSFTIDNYLNSGQEHYTKNTINPQHLQNANVLLEKVNNLGELINYQGVISSGYRSPERQRQIYAQKGEKPAMGSKHLSGHALDIYDPEGKLKEEILNKAVLERAKELGLYFENFGMTSTWVHIQDEAPGFCGRQIWSADNLLERV